MIEVVAIIGVLALVGILYLDRKSLKERAASAEATVIQKLLDNERSIKAKLEATLSFAVANAKAEAAKLEDAVRVEVHKAIDAIKVEIASKL